MSPVVFWIILGVVLAIATGGLAFVAFLVWVSLDWRRLGSS